MALPLPCDNHQDQDALILMTNLSDGSTATFCGVCVVTWAAALVAGPEGVPEITEAELEAGEVVADGETAEPTPDAEPKSDPEPAATPEGQAKQRAETAPEAEATGD